MRLLKVVLLCGAYAVLDLYLLLGWFASATPQASTTLWHRLFGALTFDLRPHPEGYGAALLGLSCLATVGLFGLLVRLNRSAPSAAERG